MNFHIAKGVFDILPEDPDPQGAWRQSHLWQYVEKTIREIACEFGYQEIRTPLFESTDLFKRSVGLTSDIVTKEMYTFEDKGGRSLTLRPEGTAPILRAFIEKNLNQIAPVHKFFYILPMFRYERQQAGRYRQHHQFGIEAIGNHSPLQDVEGIHLLWTFYERLGIKNVHLHLNSIGNRETRHAYRIALQEYLKPFFEKLSPESKERFQTNPLRILDSKNEADQNILKEAPQILEFLDAQGKAHFEQVCHLLKKIGIPYQINNKLVRGLDYYNHTVFEITSQELGSQNSLGGGGRYDGLMKEMGGADLPAFGFGAGLERVIQTLLAQKAPIPSPSTPLLFLIPMGEAAALKCFEWTCALRKAHLPVEMEMSGKKIKAAMRMANAMHARFILVIGDEELHSGEATLKEMATGREESLSLDLLIHRLQDAFQKNT